MKTLRTLSLLTAILATINAAITRAADMYPDGFWWAVLTLVALGVYFWASHVIAEREASERLRMAAYRHAVWSRRFEEMR
jgi:hypothetical protein